MEWSDVSFFLAALRTGSFTKAATVCKVKQTTVGRRVSALEKELGGSLFHRTARGLLPTDLAKELLPHAELAEYHLSQMETLSLGRSLELVGSVKIALVPTMARHVLAPELATWKKRYPGLHFTFATSMQTADLIRGEADLALRFFRPTQGDLVVKKVTELSQGIIGHKDYLKAFEPPIDPEALDWICLDLSMPYVPTYDWLRANIRKEPLLRTNDYGTLVEAVNRGAGVAMMSRVFTGLLPGLEEVSLELPEMPPQEVWLVTHKTLRHVPRIDAIWKELETLCGDLF